jgi:hypothetical protein
LIKPNPSTFYYVKKKLEVMAAAFMQLKTTPQLLDMPIIRDTIVVYLRKV